MSERRLTRYLPEEQPLLRVGRPMSSIEPLELVPGFISGYDTLNNRVGD